MGHSTITVKMQRRSDFKKGYLLWVFWKKEIPSFRADSRFLSATSTHFKWELMLYCLHCPTLNKVFLLLLLLFCAQPMRDGVTWYTLSPNLPQRRYILSQIWLEQVGILSIEMYSALWVALYLNRKNMSFMSHLIFIKHHLTLYQKKSRGLRVWIWYEPEMKFQDSDMHQRTYLPTCIHNFLNNVVTLSNHRCRSVLSSFHASARPSVRPERLYRSNSLMVPTVILKFCGMMHSTTKQIAI